MDTEIKNQVRQIVRSTQNVIASPKNRDELVQSLERIRLLLPDGCSYSKSGSLNVTDLNEARKIFEQSHYSRFLEFLINQISVDWMNQLPKHHMTFLFDDFFLKGNCQDALICLASTVSNSSPSFKLNKCISLLETFIQGHGISNILWEFCHPSGFPAHNDTMRETIVLLITTMPERVANKLQRETSEIFLPQSYIPVIVDEILITLNKVYASLKSSKDVSMGITSALFGKMCIMGYGDLVVSHFLPKILPLIKDDYIWCRISEKLIVSIPERCSESVVTVLLKEIPWYGIVDKLLGNAVMTNSKLQFLMTNKLILLRHFDQSRILQNIIGYLSSSPTRKPLYKKMMKTLLEVWADGSAIKHTSYEQHQYISRAILICVAFMQDKDKTELREDLLEKLMPGVQLHLDSSVMPIRRLGMVVAEALTAAVHPTGEKLNFNYEEDKETESLKKLLMVPEKQEIPDDDVTRMKIGDLTLNESTKPLIEEKMNQSQGNEDLDSDDDLEPYDMSHDVKVTKKKKIVYIRDCMEGLISTEDPDKVELCLTAAENIIRSQPDGIKEIAAEFTKVLLHLQDNCAVVNFGLMRHRTLVALNAQCPVEVSECLTREFFDRNYNMKQRMDMLEVLASAAQELSQASPLNLDHKKQQPKIQVINKADETKPESQHWREIVQNRIESKTRRFGKGRTKPEAMPVANKFAPVAGHFFFPLIKSFDQKENTFDLLGEDHILLVRLLYTLGIILYAAVNAPIVRQMSKALLEFLMVFRYHPQQGVIRAVLFALSMMLLATPGHMILADLQSEMYEVKIWLQDILDRSVDEESRKLAMQALMLIQQLVQKEYEATPD